MLYTENLKLNKPQPSDVVDILKLSDNFDTIDENIHEMSNDITRIDDKITDMDENAEAYNENLIIDGAFQVWEDGTQFELPNVASGVTQEYTATMWQVYYNCISRDIIAEKIEDGIKISSQNTPNGACLLLRTDKLKQERYTMSFDIKSNRIQQTNLYCQSDRKVILDKEFGITTEWSRVVMDLELEDKAVGEVVNIYMGFLLTGDKACLDNVFECSVRNVKIEQGEIATKFVKESYSKALSDSKFYYNAHVNKNDSSGVIGNAMIYKTGSEWQIPGFIFPQMRTIPTVNMDIYTGMSEQYISEITQMQITDRSVGLVKIKFSVSTVSDTSYRIDGIELDARHY